MPAAAVSHTAVDDPAAIYEEARRAHEALIELCRQDVNEFCRYVMKDEVTLATITQAPVHVRMQKLARKHKRLVLITAPELGKSQQIAVARILFELGHHPNKRFAILGYVAGAASQTVQQIARYIKHSAELHEVFPNLQPGDPWTKSYISVRRTGIGARDPSVKAYAFGTSITGARIDGLVIDDLVTSKNSQTKRRRDAIVDYVNRSLENRMTDGGWVVILSNAWHPDDLVHRIDKAIKAAKAAGKKLSANAWHVERMPVLNPDGTSVWPERWPMRRIETVREGLLERGLQAEWYRQYLCIAREDTDARFTEEAINSALRAGADLQLIKYIEDLELPEDTLLPGMPPVCAHDAAARARYIRSVLAFHKQQGTPPPFLITTGVDLAVKRHNRADYSAIVTILTLPDGRKMLLDVQAGRWRWREICSRIIDTYERFSSAMVLVENVAAQDYIVQEIQDISDVPVVGYTTGSAKVDPDVGVEAIAANLEAGKWIIPGAPTGQLYDVQEETDLRCLLDDMLNYAPGSHTGDRLMAFWFADMASRMIRRRMSTTIKVGVLGARSGNPNQRMLGMGAQKPMLSRKHKRQRLALDPANRKAPVSVETPAVTRTRAPIRRGPKVLPPARPGDVVTSPSRAERKALLKERARAAAAEAKDPTPTDRPYWWPRDIE